VKALQSKKWQTMVLGILASIGTQYADQPWWMAVIAASVASVYIASQAYVDRGLYVAKIEMALDAAREGIKLGEDVEKSEDK
jgi:hypothetical protein